MPKVLMEIAIATDFMREMDEEGLKSLMQSVTDWKTLDQGAATLVVAGFDPGLNCESLLQLNYCCDLVNVGFADA